MRRFFAAMTMGAVVLALTAVAAEAGKCGKAACGDCQSCSEKPACGCGVDVQYEAHEVTYYETVYEEVKEVKQIDAVKYVPETELRDVPCSVCKPAAAPVSSRMEAPKANEAIQPLLSLDEAMRRHIEAALTLTGGRVEGPRGAAALLKINPHTLRARMRKLGISWDRFREHPREPL